MLPAYDDQGNQIPPKLELVLVHPCGYCNQTGFNQRIVIGVGIVRDEYAGRCDMCSGEGHTIERGSLSCSTCHWWLEPYKTMTEGLCRLHSTSDGWIEESEEEDAWSVGLRFKTDCYFPAYTEPEYFCADYKRKE